jgi:flagellar protein FlgJ
VIDPINTSGPTMTGAAPAVKNDPAKIAKAAQQFEALLIGQMMKSMQDSEGGWLGTGEDDSASSAMEYGQEMFAQALSANGGLGVGKLVVAGLNAPAKH